LQQNSNMFHELAHPGDNTMSADFYQQLTQQLETTRAEGLYKNERIITSAQQADIAVADGRHVINFCANNYLGLANHPALIEAAKKGMDSHGFGMASVRFICGTQDSHKQLEQRLAEFLGMEDSILYSSCFDANGGLFETLLGPEDAIISDALNHASIIDGVRLCKAKRYRYANNDMTELRAQLEMAKADGARHIMIATDGVFSMDGVIADLKSVCDLADEYGALVMVDDSHAVGFVGENGRGTHEYCEVMGRVDIITGTLGKALGGASGGYTAGRKEVIEWLRQRSRPYLFSNSLAPAIVAASIKVLELLADGDELRNRLWSNARLFREKMSAAGFTLAGADHAIIPVMLGDAKLAQEFANELLKEGIYVTGFFFPVVPKGQARIRTQMSADHTPEQIERAVAAFIRIGKQLGVIA
jgi:glycine C-acetyltransferase